MTYQHTVERLAEIARGVILEVFFFSIQRETNDKVLIRRIEFEKTYEEWYQRVFNVLVEADNDFGQKRPFHLKTK